MFIYCYDIEDAERVLRQEKRRQKRDDLHIYLIIDKDAPDESFDSYYVTDIDYKDYGGQRYYYNFIK